MHFKVVKMHVFLTYFPINHYQFGVAHSNEVSEEAQRSDIWVKVIKRSKRSKKFNCQIFISKHYSKGILLISLIFVELSSLEWSHIFNLQTVEHVHWNVVKL